ncbi:phage baseplate protein [Dyella sp. M7H15-1]|uniref:GPW/gp25 family protein n=1 Tax=Dyella sp. M7H15-1 TaxID=2501295 RepID=UPI001004DD9D|nr:GPW/gp25 family protein [Dyella sp. M7H15-1]QAU22888.1 phage baseplate protein [Dyella sp. M7H15-1]
MLGTDANTGKPLEGLAHLRQSVRDILTTPLGSRVMRRDYGSELFALVDKPLTRSTVMDIYGATAKALAKWEPRMRLKAVSADVPAPGELVISITGVVDGRLVRLDGLQVA